MSLPVDPGRYIRAGLVSMRRLHTPAVVHHEDADCDGSGWKVRAGAVTCKGRVFCPLCRDKVPATPAGTGVVQLAHHQRRRP